jgi:hypothetical protein
MYNAYVVARIRIVDEWLRSPVSTPSNHRAIMVVASSWSEQRVLMRAYAGSADQTRPTIVLHGVELAISPAGTDPHGEWGIHVEPPVDGRAQQLREQLELAAKRLAGSKGNPPRLVDEVPNFENKATNMWAPGTPRATPSKEHDRVDYFEPAEGGARTMLDPAAAQPASRATPMSAPAAVQSANAGGGFRSTPIPVRPRSSSSSSQMTASSKASGKPRRRRTGWTSPVPLRQAPVDGQVAGGKTVLGFDTGGATLARQATSGGGNDGSGSLAKLVGKTMPIGFSLSDEERRILNALGRAEALTASEVAEIAQVANAIQWMESLMSKLLEHGLDLIAPGEDRQGEPTYLLRR